MHSELINLRGEKRFVKQQTIHTAAFIRTTYFQSLRTRRLSKTLNPSRDYCSRVRDLESIVSCVAGGISVGVLY